MLPSELFDNIIKLIEIAIIPFGVYVVRAVAILTEEARMIRTVLIGADGKNGMRSRLRRLENRVEGLALAQAARHGEAVVIHNNDEEDE